MKTIAHNLLLFAALALPALCAAQPKPTDDPQRNLQKFDNFYRYLNMTYVDTVHNGQLVENAIREVLLQLDPHSAYVSPEKMVEVNESFDGSFSGIGIEFNVLNDTIIVVNVISGGPSEKVGLLPNDRIVEVNGQNVVGTKRIDVPKILRGPKGTKAETRVVRRGVEEPLDFTIVRDNIPINTVDAAYKVDPSTGYIRVNRFANNTFKEFAEAIDKMGPIDALILDLRGNGGGLMDQAIRMSNYFLPQGSVIVSTEGMKVPSDRIVAPSDGPFKGKVIVLVNETSASASEIVSGALQDWDRGLLIGRRTFGKGLVQRQFPLNDGSAVRLTVARYHTPTGRVIQRPFRYGDREGYYEDFNRRFQTGDSAVKEEVDSTQVYKTLRLGRTVYGGGGITPDIIVEADTSGYTEYWGNLIRKGIINEFVVEYMDKNRAAILAEYPTPDRFIHEYAAGPEVTGELIRAAEQKGIPYDEEQFRKSETDIRTQLKALFAQKLWSVNEFYRVINAEQDPEFAKALEALKNWDSFSQGISG